MLDEAEWAEVMAAKEAGARWLEGQTARRPKEVSGGLSLQSITREEHEGRFRPMLEAYERITGIQETNANAIWHHRLSLYGPACKSCGKPLRTPEAKVCAACGRRRSESDGA